MLQPWLQLWEHSSDIATGSPQVMAQRMHLMSTQPWAPATWFETQQMFLEKWTAMAESWQALLWSPWPHTPQVPSSTASHWPGHPIHTTHVVTQTLAPFSRRVNENTRRLKHK